MVEAEVYDYDARFDPPGLDLVEREDALYWASPDPVRWANRVARVRWSEPDVERGIDEVLRFYRSRGRSDFTWCIGPSTLPRSLGNALRAHGFTLAEGVEARLLSAELPIHDLRVNPAVRIEDAREADALRRWLRFSDPQRDDAAVERQLPDRLRLLDVYGERAGFLLAYLDHDLVGNAAWRDSTDGQCVYLAGAGTREQFRRRGVYSTLVAHRIERALARGRRFATLRADPRSSAPILLKRGFRDHGSIAVFVSPGAR